jgi:putative membrane protein
MIAHYTDHAANERTFLAWIRTGLAVAAFGLLLAKLNVFLDVIAGESLPRTPVSSNSLIVAAGHHVGLALVLIGIAIIARSGVAFARTRRDIDSDEVTRFPRSYLEPALAAVLAIAAGIFGLYVAVQ